MLAIVAEETGYPTDLLDMDLDLEADLGIDTVKQAEVFASIREAYGIERDDSLKLRDYPTLNHVVAFVNERSRRPPGAAGARASADAGARAGGGGRPVAAAAGGVEGRVLAIVAEETGYPTDLLDMDLDLEADLGIDTVKQAEVFASIREAYGIERDDSLKLRDYPTLNHVVAFVNERSAAAQPEAAPEPAPAAAPQSQEPAPAEPVAVDGFPRRVPIPVVRPPLDCCVPTGVELGDGTRVVLMPDREASVRHWPGASPSWASRCWRSRAARRSRSSRPRSRPGERVGPSTASTGWRRSTGRVTSRTSTPPPGARGCTRGSSCWPPRCAR